MANLESSMKLMTNQRQRDLSIGSNLRTHVYPSSNMHHYR